MNMYTHLACVYDEFMENVDYELWSKRITEILRSYGIGSGLVLDLACGTGEMTIRLSRAGYEMIGVDASENMREIASEKAEDEGCDILFLNQLMESFELYGTVAAVVCVCDSINYLTGKENVEKTFRLVNNYLDPKGIFIFDFNTRSHYGSIGDDTIAENGEEASFIWDNYYDEESGLNTSELTLFIRRDDGAYEKEEEVHVQRAYGLEEIKEMLAAAGLDYMSAYDGYEGGDASSDSSRIVVIAREKGK